MNYAAVLTPVFDRHEIASRMRRVIVRSFENEEIRASDVPLIRSFRTDPILKACVRECRVAASNHFLNRLFQGAANV